MNNLRPKYHITALKNWINDPNGVIKFRGRYHVFFQHHPYGITWGPMHWGHVVSDDLLHWEHLPYALTPGDSYDKDGCFSGSCVVHNDRLYIVYTGFIFNEEGEKIRQQQCLAYSDDGVNFTKVGLIIGEDNLPKEFASNDFRDPMVYKDNDEFFMFVSARRRDGRGNILKYKSRDLLKWEFVTDILLEDSVGTMIECPDYIKNLNLLIYSEQFRPIDGYKHHNVHTSIWRVGRFNKDEKFIEENSGLIDYGFDFYAPQVILDGNILIGWMNMWDRNNPSEKYGFSGSLTIPRKIEIIDNELIQTPIVPTDRVERIILDKKYQEHIKIGFYKIEAEDLDSFLLKVRKGEKHETSYMLKGKEWVFDRSHSGEEIKGSEKDDDSINGVRRMPYIEKKSHEIYIVLDEFSIELFVDGRSMTSLIYPDLEEDLLELEISASKAVMYKFS